MVTLRKRKLYSILFSSIFFLKMVIATAPIYHSFLDQDHILSVIMQLEIEGKPHVGSETSKAICIHRDDTVFIGAVKEFNRNAFLLQNDRDLKSFYPSVPTPPPNC